MLSFLKTSESDATSYSKWVKTIVVCLPFVSLSFITTLLHRIHNGYAVAIDPILYPILVITSILIAVILFLNPKKLFWLIASSCLGLASYFVVKLIYILFVLPSNSRALHEMTEGFYWVATIYFLAFLIPNLRLGQVITTIFTTLFLAVGLIYIIFSFGNGFTWNIVYGLVQQMLASSIFFALTFTFFRFRKHYDRTKSSERLAHNLARYDKLTGLPNRLMLQEELEQLTSSPTQNSALFFIDIDGFKSINDTLGHQIGDELLKNIAKRFTSILEKNNQGKEHPKHTQDFTARISGDEFVYIARDLKNLQKAEDIATDLLATFNLPFTLLNQQVTITSSIGFCYYPEHGTDPSSLLNKADIAMYSAKQSGKNKYCAYSSDMTSEAEERNTLLKELRTAIAQNEFELYYQPIINLKSNRIEKFEALIRWKHPEKGFIAPNDFIPIAEQAGLIIPIDRWVLKEACKTAHAWQDFLPSVAVTVNMSASQLQVPDLVEYVLETLEQTGLPAALLEIEVTESIIIDNLSVSNKPLSNLRNYGIKTAIDDFGTGYSSLAYLQELLADTVKIDRSFTSKLDITNANLQFSQKLMEAVTDLAEYSGKEVVAEGIETIEQLQKLTQLGCHLGQGFYFSKPIPYTEFTTLLNSLPLFGIDTYQDSFDSNFSQV